MLREGAKPDKGLSRGGGGRSGSSDRSAGAGRWPSERAELRAGRGWRDGGGAADLGEDLVRGAEIEFAAGPVIDAVGGLLQSSRIDVAQCLALADVLPDETVGVLVEPAFPRAVGAGEVDVGGQRLRDVAVSGELLAVVEGEGEHEGRERGQQVGDGVTDQGCGLACNRF